MLQGTAALQQRWLFRGCATMYKRHLWERACARALATRWPAVSIDGKLATKVAPTSAPTELAREEPLQRRPVGAALPLKRLLASQCRCGSGGGSYMSPSRASADGLRSQPAMSWPSALTVRPSTEQEPL